MVRINSLDFVLFCLWSFNALRLVWDGIRLLKGEGKTARKIQNRLDGEDADCYRKRLAYLELTEGVLLQAAMVTIYIFRNRNGLYFIIPMMAVVILLLVINVKYLNDPWGKL